MSYPPIKDSLISAAALYKTALPKFIWWVIPLSIVSLAIYEYPETSFDNLPVYGLQTLVYFIVYFITEAVVLTALLRTQYPGLQINLTGPVLLRFIATEILVTLAIVLGLVLLLLPALLVSAATMLAPIYVLAYGRGPLQAFASSTRAMKGALLRTSLVLGILIAVLGGASFATEYLPKPLEFAASVVLEVLGMYYDAWVVVIFAALVKPEEIQSERGVLGGS